MSTSSNYYDILGLSARRSDHTLSADEIKAAYRKALLLNHPDKRSQIGSDPLIASHGSITVDEIAIAYKTLSEPALRAEYDRWLQTYPATASSEGSSKHPYVGLETVDLDDLTFDPQSELWSRGCRCGDLSGFVVSEGQLEREAEDGEIIIGCKGCSLWLRVLFGVEE